MISDLEIRMFGANRVYALPFEGLIRTYDKNVLGLAWKNNIWLKPGLNDYESEFVARHELRHVNANLGNNAHPDCVNDAKKLVKLREKSEYRVHMN